MVSKLGSKRVKALSPRLVNHEKRNLEKEFNTFLSPQLSLSTKGSDSLKATPLQGKLCDFGKREIRTIFNFDGSLELNQCAALLHTENEKELKQGDQIKSKPRQAYEMKPLLSLPEEERQRVPSEKEIPLSSVKMTNLLNSDKKANLSSEFRAPNPRKRKMTLKPSLRLASKSSILSSCDCIFCPEDLSGSYCQKDPRGELSNLSTKLEVKDPPRKLTLSDTQLRYGCPPTLKISSKEITYGYLKKGVKKPCDYDNMDCISEGSEGSSHPSETMESMVGLVTADIF
ncbi:unnamed protein product [Moneuplotes crassus]|uniref:Uncharacterized protein n=1 Tax=Euplotes crassus TaxID=5936 RepID=A0AAD1XC47_EUPCR|nr:unnamed protein product [Moneuplotes crassus]